jgi:HSP20 family protein
MTIDDRAIDDLGEPGLGAADERHRDRGRRRNYVRPPVDIYATDTEIVVLADVPGVRRGDVEVTLERDELIVEARAAGREEEESPLPWGYYRRFRLRTPFERERIRARLKGGVLQITLPKAVSAGPQRVAVE